MDCINNDKDEPVKELQDLRQEYNSFRTLYNKETIRHEQIENKLSEFTDALDSSVNAVIIADLEGQIRYANPAFLNMFEYTNLDQVICKYASKLFSSKKVRKFSDVSAIINNSKGETVEFLARSRDGEEFNVEVSSSIITSRLGKTTGSMASFVNITKRKDAEYSIKAQNHELENRAVELINANKELVHQNILKEKRATELIIADKELTHQNILKEKRAAELVIANKELVFQNGEKEKRAAELVVANKELAHLNILKEKRTVELMNAKDKAEASDRLKTAFMNNISHEIRTPLNGILGFAPFVIQPNITMEEKEGFLEILNSSSERLMNTINEFMDISLIISGNMEVHLQPIDISSLLANVFENFQESSLKKNLALKIQFPDNVDNLILNTDGELLRKAVSKLLDNSVKFTKEGNITLGFELINNEIEIFVKDTGIGIEKDSQELIYKSFMQEDVSSTRGHEGSGLGLSISKGIMQLLGGKIRLESKKDMGTTAFLSLPINTSAASSKVENSTNAIKLGERPLILIAEDDDSNYFCEEILLRKDYNILRAYNGQEAVDLCKEHSDINLVLMDIKMPFMTGIEATHIIKSFRNDLPIIAVTAHAQSGDEFKIKEAGCDEYISKPINKTKLLSLIQKYFQK